MPATAAAAREDLRITLRAFMNTVCLREPQMIYELPTQRERAREREKQRSRDTAEKIEGEAERRRRSCVKDRQVESSLDLATREIAAEVVVSQ